MWLQLRQVLKKSTLGNVRKFTVSFAFFPIQLMTFSIFKHSPLYYACAKKRKERKKQNLANISVNHLFLLPR